MKSESIKLELLEDNLFDEWSWARILVIVVMIGAPILIPLFDLFFFKSTFASGLFIGLAIIVLGQLYRFIPRAKSREMKIRGSEIVIFEQKSGQEMVFLNENLREMSTFEIGSLSIQKPDGKSLRLPAHVRINENHQESLSFLTEFTKKVQELVPGWGLAASQYASLELNNHFNVNVVKGRIVLENVIYHPTREDEVVATLVVSMRWPLEVTGGSSLNRIKSVDGAG